MQSLIKEVKHTIRVKHENKSNKYVILQRIKLVSWDWSITLL